MNNNDIQIVLLAGGASPERPVSKDSSRAIYDALVSLGYKVKVIDPAYGANQTNDIEKYFAEEDYAIVSSDNYCEALTRESLKNVDMVFLGLHGLWGEDGTVQSILDLNKTKYTGSGILGSALGMDKNLSKVMFRHYGVGTAEWFIYSRDEKDVQRVKNKIENSFGYPCVIKPNDSGSTIGLTVCKDCENVEAALEDAAKYSAQVIVEEFIPGHELTVGVIDQLPLPPLEIKPKHGLYDYECKYTDGMSEYIVPAPFPDTFLKYLQEQALLAYNAIGCENYARVDFRVNEKMEAYCLEVNTLPGMTSHSLVPKMAKALGISFEELIDKIVKSTLT